MINTKIRIYSIEDVIETLAKNPDLKDPDAFVSELTGMSIDRIAELKSGISAGVNTKFEYLYRDADNYKKFQEVIVAGTIDEEGIETILKSLDGGEYFIPEQIGLPCERFGEITESDHCFCEVANGADSFTRTTEPITEYMTAEELVKKFKEVRYWDVETYAVEPEAICEDDED